MLGIETLLPHSVAKAYHVKDFVEPLRARIDAARDASPMSDIIDWSIVTPEVSADARNLVEQFECLEDAEYQAMFRTALFARQLLLMMYGERAVLKLPELPTTKLGLVIDAVRQDATEKAMDYTSEYVGIDDLLGAYTYELDPTCRYGHRIEEIGGYIIMCGEASEAAWALFDEINNIRPQDIIGQ